MKYVLAECFYGLYGLDNFYYRRYRRVDQDHLFVYTDLIISTIVD